MTLQDLYSLIREHVSMGYFHNLPQPYQLNLTTDFEGWRVTRVGEGLHKFSETYLAMFFLENIKQTNPFEGRKISDSNNIVFFDMIFQAFFNCWHLQSPRLEVILDMLTQSQRCSYWGGASPTPQEFGRSVHPIQTRGQVMPTTLLLAHSDLKT